MVYLLYRGTGAGRLKALEQAVPLSDVPMLEENISLPGLAASATVTDYAEIATRGVMSTPGLVIDGTVVLAGRVPTRAQVAAWLGVA